MIKKSLWNNLKEFFSYLFELGKLIYSKVLFSFLRIVIKNLNAFPDDYSVCKIMYLSIDNLTSQAVLDINLLSERVFPHLLHKSCLDHLEGLSDIPLRVHRPLMIEHLQ